MKNYLLLFGVLIVLWGCSASQQNNAGETNTGEQIYVFDDVSDVSTNTDSVAAKDTLTLKQSEPVQSINNFVYYVQVGAFTSEERAQRFVLFNKDKTSFPLNISYSDDVQLWVVRLPEFSTKEDAEKVRDDLWQTEAFKDAFIVTVSK